MFLGLMCLVGILLEREEGLGREPVRLLGGEEGENLESRDSGEVSFVMDESEFCESVGEGASHWKSSCVSSSGEYVDWREEGYVEPIDILGQK